MSNGPRYRGKTFHEYMSAKFWHPASKRNIVTVWKRKEQMKAEKRKHDERAEEARRLNFITFRKYVIRIQGERKEHGSKRTRREKSKIGSQLPL